MSRIELKHIDKFYGSNHVLRDINLTIEDGDFMTLLGPSGCGKTTTLRVVSGLEKPQNGIMTIDGVEMINADDAYYAEPSKRGLNLVFQSYALWPHMTVYDNIAFGLKIQKMDKAEIERRVMDSLKMMRIDMYKDRYPTELSGGQQQRVALARAVVIEPSVLLFDEPLSNLDAKLRESMRDELRALQKRLGITSLYVTHDQSEAMAISDRVVIMKDGNIMQQGTPTEIYEQPNSRFVANFIGKANFIDGVFRGRDGEAALVEMHGKTFSIPAPGKMEDVVEGGGCCLAVRPESILLSATEGHLPGTISRATYYGTKVEYEVMLGEQPIIVEVYNPQLSERFTEGQEVRMTLIDRCVRVLK